MNRVCQRWPKVIVCVFTILALAACAPAPATHPAPSPVSTAAQVSVTGTFSMEFEPDSIMAYSVGDAIAIVLESAEHDTRISLFVPPGIEDGIYPIDTSFSAKAPRISGRIGLLRPGSSRYFESTSGRLVLHRSDTLLSGSFAFEAATGPTGSDSLTVQGTFEAIPFGF